MISDVDDTGWTAELGVALVEQTPAVHRRPSSEDQEWYDEPRYEDASGRRGRRGLSSGGVVVQWGEDVVRAAVRGWSAQIATIVQEVAAGLDGAGTATGTPGGFGADAVEISFGLTLNAGAGKVIESVLSVQGEAAVNVTVSLSRRVPAS